MSSILAQLSEPERLRKVRQWIEAGNPLQHAVEYKKRLRLLNRVWHFATKVHLNTHREKLTFTDKRYLTQIYKDFSDRIAIKKSVQSGISEMLIIRAFAYAESGYYVLYVLPKYDLRGRFVHNRIDPLFSIIPEYRTLLKDAVGESESVTLKHFGAAAINFVGSNSESEFIEYPADAIIIDEMDRCYQPNLVLANDRLDASTLKQRIAVSTPTITGYGIDDEFENTDGMTWQMKCNACGEWQCLEWDVNVVKQVSENNFELLDIDWTPEADRDIFRFCRMCGKRLESDKTTWVATRQHEHRGYHLSQLFSNTISIRSLWETFKEALGNPYALQVFYNSKLGLAYTASGAQLSRPDLDNCRTDYLMSRECAEYTSMGIDVGKLLHVRISSRTSEGKRKAEFIGTVTEFSELADLITRYRVHTCVIDAYPETRKAKEFQQAQRRVWLCRFVQNLTMVQMREDDQTLSVDRTQIFDHLVAEIRKGNLCLPKNAGLVDGYFDQIQAPVRLQDAVTGRNYWTEGTKPDHFFLAEVYDLLAFQLMERNRLVIY